MTDFITLSDPLLTVRQFMATLGISRKIAYDWIGDGRINAVRFGGRIRIRKSEIEKFVADLPAAKRAA